MIELDEMLIDGICQIANKIKEKRGYATVVKKSDVKIVLEALAMFNEEVEKYDKMEEKIK